MNGREGKGTGQRYRGTVHFPRPVIAESSTVYCNCILLYHVALLLCVTRVLRPVAVSNFYSTMLYQGGRVVARSWSATDSCTRYLFISAKPIYIVSTGIHSDLLSANLTSAPEPLQASPLPHTTTTTVACLTSPHQSATTITPIPHHHSGTLTIPLPPIHHHQSHH